MKHGVILLTLTFLLVPLRGFPYQPAVVSAHPEASKVGLEILRKGGSATDAAIATAFALSVVEPHNSGPGGGGFLLYFDTERKRFSFLDYREAAPAKATKGIYASDPQLLERGILSIAVPGFVLGMETIHRRWKKLPWSEVIQPAIDLAEKAVPIGGALQEKIDSQRKILEQDPEAKRIFLTTSGLLERMIDLSDLTATFKSIQSDGARVFYAGAIGKKIAAFIRKRGGLITMKDLANYRVYWRRPHEFEYGDYRIVSAPPPSSGGAGLDLLFKKTIINNLEGYAPLSPAAYEVLLQGLKDYFDYRDVALGDTPTNILAHTTHLCVIDAEGNMAAMTNTLNYPFGSGLVVPGTGILLNNEMNDFSLRKVTANSVGGGKRPLSSMAPTIVMKGKTPKIIIGTPGGTSIPQNIYQVLLSHWEWNLPLSQAIRSPKIYYSSQKGEVLVEKKMAKKVRERIGATHDLVERDKIGNVQALVIENEKRTRPYSDPRGYGKGFTLSD